MRRPPTRHLLPVVLAPAALLLAACADGTTGGDPGPSLTAPVASPTPGRPLTLAPSSGPSAVPTSARLTVEVDATGEGATETWTLTCGPGGGTGSHPDPLAACLVLGTPEGRAAFEPVPTDAACTQIWGGPQTAHVTGTLDGQAVDATFSRSDGCQIARWDALEPLLGTGGA